MELKGAQDSFAFLKAAGLGIAVFISDRHRSIAKRIREQEPVTSHFFDIWHVAKSLTKKLLQAGKESGCELLVKWQKAMKNHLHWCATSTKLGFGELILAKWKSIIRHVCNKHTHHPEPLFKQCVHGPLSRRYWLKKGEVIFQSCCFFYMLSIFFHKNHIFMWEISPVEVQCISAKFLFFPHKKRKKQTNMSFPPPPSYLKDVVLILFFFPYLCWLKLFSWKILPTPLKNNSYDLCSEYFLMGRGTYELVISGTNVYNKMKQILMNTRILNDIKKLSSEDQTSCLEGFHCTLNQFHPKMIRFSWLGTYCM